MREIKFRIWDIERKCMYHLLENGWSFGTCECDRAISWEDVFADKDMKDRLIPLQYTELHDKNGKEIYEGDIILTQPFRDKPFSKNYKEKRLRGIVEYIILKGDKFCNQEGIMKYWGAEWSVKIIDKEDYKKYRNCYWGKFFECEVIGTVYQNPELLKEVSDC